LRHRGSCCPRFELDGVARRILLCPPDLDPDRIQALLVDAEIDAIVSPISRCNDAMLARTWSSAPACPEERPWNGRPEARPSGQC
jgi:hypothetical protein